MALSASAQAQVQLSGPVGSGFGSTLSAYLSNIVVGAPLGGGLHGTYQGGRAYLYTKSGTGFTATDLDPGLSLPASAHFGAAVHINMGIGYIFVGAPGESAVYIFGDSTGTPTSWSKVTKLGPNGAGFGQTLDYSENLGAFVACGGGSCSFYNRQGANWMPVQTGNGVYWGSVTASRAVFVNAGESVDLITGQGDPLSPSKMTFFTLKAGTVGFQASTVLPGDNGVFGGFAATPTFGQNVARTLIAGPAPGRVQQFVQGSSPNAGFLSLPDIRLPGFGAAGAQVGTGLAILGLSAIITDRSSLTASQVFAYRLDEATNIWTQRATPYLGTGGPNYGSTLAYSSSFAVVGDPDNHSAVAFDSAATLVSVTTHVYDQDGNDTGIEIITNQIANSGTITAVLDTSCSAFATSGPGGIGSSYIEGSGSCVHVDTNSAVLVGVQKVCFPPPADPIDPFTGYGRCHENLIGSCPAGEKPSKTLTGKAYCCGGLAIDYSEPQKVCALTNRFSDIASATFRDSDGDGVPDLQDNCISVENFSQSDIDHDGIGDVCDNCPSTPNQLQLDYDADGLGNECDPTPGVLLTPTPAPATPSEWLLPLGVGLGLMGARRRFTARKARL